MIIKDSENKVHRYSNKTNWKSKRRNEILRQIFPMAAVAAAAVILVALSFVQKKETGETSAEPAIESEMAEVTEAPEELVEEPFVNILDKNNYELSVTWDGAVKKDDWEAVQADLEQEISVVETAGYSVAFLLYDLETGGGISYHPDVKYYSASAIKAPYVAWMVQAYPETAEEFYTEIENAIVWSSNEDYFTLINNFGKTEFNDWAAETAGEDVSLSEGSFGPIACRNFTRLWINIYDYFTSGNDTAEMIRDLYSGTEESAIYETLGTKYTVYSKAGWSFEGEDSYYTVQNDAGIVMKGSHPYILTILSDAYEKLDLLESVAEELDIAHTKLISQEN